MRQVLSCKPPLVAVSLGVCDCTLSIVVKALCLLIWKFMAMCWSEQVTRYVSLRFLNNDASLSINVFVCLYVRLSVYICIDCVQIYCWALSILSWVVVVWGFSCCWGCLFGVVVFCCFFVCFFFWGGVGGGGVGVYVCVCLCLGGGGGAGAS